MYAALRTCWMPPPKDSARHGMEYTVRFAFKRDGEIMAPPRVTYSSHDAPAEVRDVYRDAVNAALARCTPLHFSDGMGRRCGRSPNCHPFRGQPDHRRRKVAVITATMSLGRHTRSGVNIWRSPMLPTRRPLPSHRRCSANAATVFTTS